MSKESTRLISSAYPFLFLIAAALCLLPAVSSATALFAGAALGLLFGNPVQDWSKSWTHRLLSLSIIAMGAGMDLEVIARVGARGILYTAIGISFTLALGTLLGRALRAERNIATLISVGTAICGGSAIAAVAPVIRAKPHEVSVALAVVFLLNATALVLFPWAGHQLQLDQVQFGLWSALAIHDTSSVVGASLQFGHRALEVGTTVKLARALWIIPVTILFSVLVSKQHGQAEETRPKRPWFILGFLIAAALVTWIPVLKIPGDYVASAGRRLLVLTLFLIGSGLNRKNLATVGFRPLVQAVLVWVLVGTVSLAAIRAGLISL